MFDLKDKCIHIVDPTFRTGSESIMDQMHEHVALKLQAALANCIQEFFNGWSPDWNCWFAYMFLQWLQTAQRESC
jgi:hypothetical protein